MPRITKQQAKKFLQDIKPIDKVVIIHHDDLDGFASGILLYNFCKKKTEKISIFPMRLKEGVTEELTKKVEEYGKIIIADIPPFYIKHYFESLKKVEILYIDHHQKDNEISNNLLELRTSPKEYIPASRMIYELTEEENKNMEWIAIAGTIADYGFEYSENKEFINNFLESERISLGDYKNQVVSKISNLIVYFKGCPEEAFNLLKNKESWKNLNGIEKYAKKVEEEMIRVEKDFYKNKEQTENLWFYLLKAKFRIGSLLINKLSSKNPNKIIVFGEESKGIPERTTLHARHQSTKANVVKIMKNVIQGLENASAGGHLRACGGFIQTKDLEKFKQNLKQLN